MMEPMAGLGKYLYCIIRASEERTFDDVVPIGDAPGPVHTVSHNGLAAVVSDSPLTEYEVTRANMVAHQSVQESVMRDFTLLPVRFGTVTNTTTPVENIKKLLYRAHIWATARQILEDKLATVWLNRYLFGVLQVVDN